jgi:hypothetical protein
MRVHDGMSAGIVTAKKMDPVRSVVIKALNRHCETIPVVGGYPQFVGMGTLRDEVLPLYPHYGDDIHDTVHSRDVVEMEEGHAPPHSRSRVLPGAEELVVDTGVLLGMVSIDDISRGLFFTRGLPH